MVRFVHTADWQLGMTRRWLADDDQARFAQDRIDAVARSVDVAAAHDAAFVVVAGDVFESNHVSPRTVRRALAALARSTVPVLLLPGNHDPLDAASVYTSTAFEDAVPDQVHVLGREPWRGVAGVEVVGAPWVDKHPGTDLVGDLLDDLGPAPDDVVRVVVGHGTVDVLDPAEHRAAAIRLARVEAALARGACHYVALGDRHSTTSVGSSGAVWFSGAHEVTDFDETDPGNVLLVDVRPGDARPDVTPVHIGRWRFVDATHHVDDLDDVAAVLAALDGLPDHARTVVLLRLAGTCSLEALRRLEDGLDRAREAFAAVRLHEGDTDLVPEPDADDLDRLSLSGYAATALDELRAAAAVEGPGGRTARDALALLYRLALGSEVAA